MNPSLPIDLPDVRTTGSGIVRPEGVMALDDGGLITADGRGCCARIAPDGGTHLFGDLDGVPNGICLDTDGSVVVANIGNGKIQRLTLDGESSLIAGHASGRPIPAPNFPLIDPEGRLWVSNSTWREDVNDALISPAPDGGVILVGNGSAEVAAEGLWFANGLAMDASGRYLYVAETTRRTIVRFRVGGQGGLSGPEIFGPNPLPEGGYPDGIAFDEAENLWVTFPMLNSVGYLTPDGKLEMVLWDPEGRVLNKPTNICFGGKNRRTAFIGSLAGDRIPYFDAPYPGLRLVHQAD